MQKQTQNIRVLPGSLSAQLADNLSIDINNIVGQQVACFGIPGSGKTNFLALLIEQVCKHSVPCVIFDKEGDFKSVASVLPRGIVATSGNYPAGYDILEQGLQVVYDLSTWEDEDACCGLIISVIDGLMRWADARPNNERVPVLVVLDEAQTWLPQKRGNSLTEENYKQLAATFRNTGSTGRKRGLTTVLGCPKICELSKDVLYPGLKIFMKASLTNDLNRYLEYLSSGDLTSKQLRTRIASFATGKAIVTLPSGIQKVVTFYERASEHVSHTPMVQAALSRYSNMPFNPTFSSEKKPLELVQESATKKRGPNIRTRCKSLYSLHPTCTPEELAAMAKCSVAIARKYMNEGSDVKARIAAILAQEPAISDHELGLQAHCSFSVVKKFRKELERS